MRSLSYAHPGRTIMTTRLRILLITICTLILCSCRPLLQNRNPGNGWSDAPLPSPAPATPNQVLGSESGLTPAQWTVSQPAPMGSVEISDAGTLVPSTVGGAPGIPPMAPPGPVLVDAQGNILPRGVPPGAVAGAWTPPGIAGPWPQDEYLADGGDLPPFAGLAENGVLGVNPEDAVARFQTADGVNRVQPFNRVFIYSPRFASVRQVVGVKQDEQADRVAGVHNPVPMGRLEEVQEVGVGTQNYQARAGVQRRGIGQFESRQFDGAVSQAIGPRGFADGFKPYENFSLIVRGLVVSDEMAALAKSVQAARAWSSDQSVQIVMDGLAAAEQASVTRLDSLYRVESRYGEGKLRLVKVASTATALPGETVDFTLRFDNVGTLAINELIIIDSLSTRLEYVEGSSQSSRPAELSVEANVAGSVILKWRLTEPIPPGEGGVIRFQCRVR